jgi:hypothetical protein
MSSTGTRPPRSVVVAFGLIAMSVLLVQVVLSRLFASIMTYYYAFMPGQWRWHDRCLPDLLKSQGQYARFF